MSSESNTSLNKDLWKACKWGMESAAILLIKEGADVNFFLDHPDNPIKFTCLHIAVLYNRLNIIKILLDAGAKNQKDIQGMTPFDYAIDNKNKDIICLLIRSE